MKYLKNLFIVLLAALLGAFVGLVFRVKHEPLGKDQVEHDLRKDEIKRDEIKETEPLYMVAYSIIEGFVSVTLSNGETYTMDDAELTYFTPRYCIVDGVRCVYRGREYYEVLRMVGGWKSTIETEKMQNKETAGETAPLIGAIVK